MQKPAANKRKHSAPAVVPSKQLVQDVEHVDEEEQSSVHLSKLFFEKRTIDYGEELVMFIYYYLLEIIIDDYKVIKTDGYREEEMEEEGEEGVRHAVKDFYNIDMEELKVSDIIYVRDSKVAYSKPSFVNSSKQRSSKVSANKLSMTDLQSKSCMASTIPLDADQSFNEYWMVPCETERVIIKYVNGNIYEGTTYRKLFHGKGTFRWSDGVVYEGEFRSGDATGNGILHLSDLTYYKGDLCKGLIHGSGALYISSSPLLYNGEWKAGKKDGKGWLLYGSRNWYDGEWKAGKRHGWGTRQYDTRVRYKGNWFEGYRHGLGTMVYTNGDFYSGEWKLDLNDGYGEYTWRASLNTSFSFVLENAYQGLWANGTRDGAGIMHFGVDCGVRLTGLWCKNQKNGPGIIICRNGSIVQGNPLFVADKPVHVDRYNSMWELHRLLNDGKRLDAKRDRATETESAFELLTKRLFRSCSIASISDLPKYVPMCNPVDIPIYSPPETIYLKRYTAKIVDWYTSLKSKMFEYVLESRERSKSATNKQWNVYAINVDEYKLKLGSINETVDEAFEETALRRYLRKNATVLRRLYNHYTGLCHHGPIKCDLILVRLFLWQTYRDVGLTDKYSMISIDEILFANEDIGVELAHNPFEKIYYWQFLHCLLEIALLTYERHESIVDFKRNGILAGIFDRFLRNFLKRRESTAQNVYNPYAYINLVPIESVYLLYESIGQPHTARTFLRHCTYANGNPLLPFMKPYNWKCKRDVIEGVNVVPVGENITFYSRKPVGVQAEFLPVDEGNFKHLHIFRSLGARKIIQCLAAVCPLIITDCVICNMDYRLTFLEFYEALVFCSYILINDEEEPQVSDEEEVVKIEVVSDVVKAPKTKKKK